MALTHPEKTAPTSVMRKDVEENRKRVTFIFVYSQKQRFLSYQVHLYLAINHKIESSELGVN